MLKLKKAVILACATTAVAGWTLAPSFPSYATTMTQSQAFQVPPPPALKAQSAILIDAANGQVLYEKNADERRAPASTTKIMTMLLVLQAIHEGKLSWNDEVPVTDDAYSVAVEPGVSDAYLDPKEHFTVRDMMKFVAVLSANDATIALADKVAGTKAAFVNDMNIEAQKLGLTGTHYENPDGLPQADHYTTARDLAKLSRYLVETYPEVLQYTSLPDVTVRNHNTWPNTDELIGHYPGVDGLKTGYTADAGYCFVGTAERNGVRLISVVMGDTKNDIHQRFSDTAALFDYGFNQFTQYVPVKKGQTLTDTVYVDNANDRNLPVQPADDLVAMLPTGVHGEVKLTPTPGLKAPIEKGQQVGTLSYIVNGQTVSSVPVVAAEHDGKANFILRFFRSIGDWIGHLLHRL